MATDMPQATADADRLRALTFVRATIIQWRQQGLIRADDCDALEAYCLTQEADRQAGKQAAEPLILPAADVCWNCKEAVGPNDYCVSCGAPARTESVERLRHLICLCHEIKKHERNGRLDLSTAHGCLAEANGRIAALRRKLNGQRIQSVLPVKAPASATARMPSLESPEASPPPRVPRRNLLEMLLDPRSIQWLLALGGAALVIGLVIWLAASNNPVFVAVALGVGNALLLASGWAVIRFTRYQLAGRGLTLLACLVMPLNLWYYDYKHLITIQESGHLWVAALICCVLYVVSAVVLRDPMLVYVFVGGVALTVLLLLAEQLQANFWQISAPATFLTFLGLVCIHLERFFPADEGPFARKNFGLAFFWSGHAALGAGLLLLIGTQVADGVLYEAFFKHVYQAYHWVKNQTEIVATLEGRLLALGLVVAGTYAYVYSDVVVRKVGVYIHLAVVGFLWAELLLLSLAFWVWPELRQVESEIAIGVLAVTGLLANFALTSLVPRTSSLRRTGPVLALGLCIISLCLGMVLHFRAAVLQDYSLSWAYVGAMAATAVACRSSAHLLRADRFWLQTVYLFGGGASLLLAASGLLLTWAPGLLWEWVAPMLMLIPLGYIAAARLYRGRPMETPVVWAAHAMTLVLLLSCLGRAVLGYGLDVVVQHDQPLNLALAWFFAEAALFYLLAAIWRDREFAVYACAASAAAAVWQLLNYYNLQPEYYIAAFAVLGLALLLAYRFIVFEKGVKAGLGRAAFQSANALLSLAAVAGALLALSSLAGRKFDLWLLVGMQSILVAAGLAAMFLVRQAGWRRWYLLAAIADAILTVLVLVLHIDLTWPEKLELVCLTIGVALLVVAHLGWFREREHENDMVSFGLFVGSLLVGAPLIWAVIYCRFVHPQDFAHLDAFHTLNEVAMLAAGLLLLAIGFATRIKSTTLAGSAIMAVYLLSLVAFIQLPDMLQNVAVYLMIGGGLFFGTGLLFSIYRDRLLALPQKIKHREGVFRVLNWR